MTSTESSYVVFGATGGIGSALCRRLAETGAKLFVAARREEPIEALCDDLGAEGAALDASDFEAVDDFVAKAAESGNLRGVACCAGSLHLQPAHSTTRASLEETISQNLFTAFATVRAAARSLKKKGGSVVLCSSAAGEVGLPAHEAIAAAKAAVAGLARSAAATYASHGLRVNAVAPGLVRTPMTQEIVENPTLRAASESMHALGRVGEPEEIASVIAFLLGPDSSWITGQVWGIDGGMARVRPKTRS